MDRDPRQYSRLLILGGLFPLLLLDIAVELPDGAFGGGSALLLVAAATVHAVGGQRRAAAGWLVFAAALGFVALVDVTGDGLYVFAVVVLLLAGLLLLASERVTSPSSDDGEPGDEAGA